jgi:chromosome segregation ATPase
MAVILCAIAVIFIGGVTSKNAVLRKKVARAKAEAEKEKHKAIIEKTQETIKSLDAQIKIANTKKTASKIDLMLLKEHQKKLEEKIKEGFNKISEVNSKITNLKSAIAYAERMKFQKKI